MKKVLFIAPKYLDLYKDILYELKKKYEVDYIEDLILENDPKYKKTIIDRKSSLIYQNIVEKFNEHLLAKVYREKYHLILVVNGMLLSGDILKRIKERNSGTKLILYLWDKTYNNYSFDLIFPFFDNVFTFDSEDAKLFNINYLPLYWKPIDRRPIKYDIFSFGSYRRFRYEFYLKLSKIAKKEGLNYYLKLYTKESISSLRGFIKSIFGLFLNKYIPITSFTRGLLTNKPLPPDTFRSILNEARVIIDTSNIGQYGMTPRLIWAVGARKKIITTNVNVLNEVFYSPNNIFVYDLSLYNSELEFKQSLTCFLTSDALYTEEINNNIDKLRIDNWIRILTDKQ